MTTRTSSSPLRAVMDVRRDELPLALLMALHFFLVITVFWILKPIKKGLFIQHYDEGGFTLLSWTMTASQAELLAKVLNMVVAAVAVGAFTWLARRYRRQQLSYIFCAFFLVCCVAYSGVIDQPSGATVWSFYLFGDLFSTLMVATFFAFLNDSVTPDAARRLYGLIVFGGVTGGVFGTTTVRAFIASLTTAGWLWVCVGLLLLTIAVAWGAARYLKPAAPPSPAARAPASAGGNPALEGARLVFRVTIPVVDRRDRGLLRDRLDGDGLPVHLDRVALPGRTGDRRALRDRLRHHERPRDVRAARRDELGHDPIRASARRSSSFRSWQ